MDEELKEKRRKMTLDFMSSSFYSEFFEKEINIEIDRADKISGIKEDDIEKSYYKNKIRRDVYRGIKSKLEMWAGISKNKK